MNSMRNGKWILRAGLALPLSVLLLAALLPLQSASQPKEMTAAHRGLDNLLRRPYGLPIMTRGEYGRLWTVWDPTWKARAEQAPSQIPRLTLVRYGLTPSLDSSSDLWEPDFQDILTYINTLKPPKYPYPVDAELAESGKTVFERNCAGCHGTYGANGHYSDRIVPVEQLGTDPVRLNGIPPEWRRYYATTWFAAKSRDRALENKMVGYVAPPLDGVWSTAPYFHNVSVSTLYSVLTAEARPKIFRRVGDAPAFDRRQVGLQYETLTAPLPADLTLEQRRHIVDTSRPGLSNEDHPFGFHLTEAEKRQVIEYLKTL